MSASTPTIGQVTMVGFNFAPVDWALCNGQLLSIAENDALFALIGTVYGGDGQNTFALPDMRGRMPINQGQGPGLSNYVIGQSGGTETVTLTPQQMPQHNHVLSQTVTHPCNSGAGDSNSPAGKFYSGGTGGEDYSTITDATMSAIPFTTSIASAGGNQPHSNLSPSLCVNFVISLFGIFPQRA